MASLLCYISSSGIVGAFQVKTNGYDLAPSRPAPVSSPLHETADPETECGGGDLLSEQKERVLLSLLTFWKKEGIFRPGIVPVPPKRDIAFWTSGEAKNLPGGNEKWQENYYAYLETRWGVVPDSRRPEACVLVRPENRGLADRFLAQLRQLPGRRRYAASLREIVVDSENTLKALRAVLDKAAPYKTRPRYVSSEVKLTISGGEGEDQPEPVAEGGSVVDQISESREDFPGALQFDGRSGEDEVPRGDEQPHQLFRIATGSFTGSSIAYVMGTFCSSAESPEGSADNTTTTLYLVQLQRNPGWLNFVIQDELEEGGLLGELGVGPGYAHMRRRRWVGDGPRGRGAGLYTQDS